MLTECCDQFTPWIQPGSNLLLISSLVWPRPVMLWCGSKQRGKVRDSGPWEIPMQSCQVQQWRGEEEVDHSNRSKHHENRSSAWHSFSAWCCSGGTCINATLWVHFNILISPPKKVLIVYIRAFLIPLYGCWSNLWYISSGQQLNNTQQMSRLIIALDLPSIQDLPAIAVLTVVFLSWPGGMVKK